MIPTIEFLNRYFHVYNELYFGTVLPESSFVLMNTENLLGQYLPSSRIIRISRAYDGEERFFQNILIHEMIHYYLDFINDNDVHFSHGPHFKREAARINKYGWSIRRCATDEEMSLARLIKKPQTKRKAIITPLSLLSNPFTEEELINFILHSKRKDKDVIIWLSYPSLQNMVYAELNEDDCIEEHYNQRCRAIEKAYKLLINFNSGNKFNLYVLYNDLAAFYYKIQLAGKASLSAKKSITYKGATPSTFITVQGKKIEPIKLFDSVSSSLQIGYTCD